MRLEFKEIAFVGWAVPTDFAQKVGTAHPTVPFWELLVNETRVTQT
jgi:hypothetical protein